MKVKHVFQEFVRSVAYNPPIGDSLLAEYPAIRGTSPEYPNAHNQTGVFGTMSYIRMLPVLLVAAIALVAAALVGCSSNSRGQGMQIPFSDSRIIIEVNATDGDSGIQIFLDGEGWTNVNVDSPDATTIVDVLGEGSVGEQGITELFFESAEPSFDDLPLDEFLARFPEGQYNFFGTTVDGDELIGAATLTHILPCGPEIVIPAEDAVLDPDMPVVIEWNPVTNELDPVTAECQDQESPRLEIVGYQVIVLREEPEPLLEFSVNLPASATSVTVPPEFLEPATVYKFEVLAIEESGNQTLTESTFETE
jgi:hypothetical protein